jgi:hypothetical protein
LHSSAVIVWRKIPRPRRRRASWAAAAQQNACGVDGPVRDVRGGAAAEDHEIGCPRLSNDERCRLLNGCGAQNSCPWASWLTIAGFGPSSLTGTSRGGGWFAFWSGRSRPAFRPRGRLIAENLCLRQQLLVLQRRHPQPRLVNADRRFWIIASRWFSSWRGSLLHCETRDSVEVASSGAGVLSGRGAHGGSGGGVVVARFPRNFKRSSDG